MDDVPWKLPQLFYFRLQTAKLFCNNCGLTRIDRVHSQTHYIHEIMDSSVIRTSITTYVQMFSRNEMTKKLCTFLSIALFFYPLDEESEQLLGAAAGCYIWNVFVSSNGKKKKKARKLSSCETCSLN
jgi:hypothetical protein